MVYIHVTLKTVQVVAGKFFIQNLSEIRFCNLGTYALFSIKILIITVIYFGGTYR